VPTSLTSLYFKTLDKLADLLSNCPAFQTWTSTASAAAAKARIFQIYDKSSATWPLAVITCENDFSGSRDCEGNGLGCFTLTEGCTLIFEKTPSTVDADAVKTFCNEVNAIFAEMLDRQSSYLFIQNFSMQGPLGDDELVTAANARQKILRIVYTLKWGM
jgi:hypothetical protein